ncbi:MAG: DUF1292 domain-containing protein [Clostridiales bacterium]|nr:DUF1292 domain-containing protein [Clostridiales bacterium]
MNEKIVELIDETGAPARFRHMMTLEYMGNHYLILAPGEDGGEQEEVVVMAIHSDENGDEYYEPVSDENTAHKVFLEFLSILDMDEENENA